MGTSSNETRGSTVQRRSGLPSFRGTRQHWVGRLVATLSSLAALTAAPRVFAQETLDAAESNPDAPLAGAWKVRLDAPLLWVRNTDADFAGMTLESGTSSFGFPAGAASFQVGYALSAANNLGVNLGWSRSESTVDLPTPDQESIETATTQYRLGVYGEHLFLTEGALHPSLGVVGELLGGDSASSELSGLGLGFTGGLQVFVGHHASLDLNLRAEWVSLSVGSVDMSGLEFGAGLGFAVWLGG